jgi:hypothetical protein
MARLRFAVADHAHDAHVIELSEFIGHTALLLELLFALMAPSLQVVRVAAVLNETSWCHSQGQQVLADDRCYASAVRAAIDQHWLSHISSAV